jgi:acetyltransferase
MLVSLTQIDYDYDIALVAFDKTQTKERMVGVARIMSKPGGIEPEFAVAVGDPWQGKGVGAILMEYLLAIAKERGIKTIGGIVLAENTQMLAFAKKLGCKISRGQDGGGEYELKIDLKAA